MADKTDQSTDEFPNENDQGVEEGKIFLTLVPQEGGQSKSGKALTIHDFNFLATLGTGTFGRVRLV